MHISKFISSVAILGVTVSSSPTGWVQWLEGRSSRSLTAYKSELEARANPQLRIMVAGASIAAGYASSDGNGFRLGLQEAVEAGGNDVQMLGTVRSGTMQDNAHEADPGIKINDVTARIDAALPKLSPLPNIVLVQVGANDLAAGTSPDTMAQRISVLIDHVFNAIPDVNLVMSTLLPSLNTESGAVAYNAKLREVVDAQSQNGRHIYYADVHTGFSPADILPEPDGTHPTDGGYQKMARVYAGVVLDIVKDRFAPPPSIASTVSSTKAAEPVVSTTTSESTSPSPSPSSSSFSDSTSVSSTEVTTSSAAQKQVATKTADSSTLTTSTGHAFKGTSSSSIKATVLAASTSAPASTPSASSPPKKGSGSNLSQPGLLITAIAMLACTAPLLAV